ncbi:(2Fe-2S)-binding protein [Cytobacillus depressus]|uniref:(2Fe-2S)-binding protein n=1 Tax=Cytobacillus depressus TaxID=1602942 RepID=UPI003CCD8FFF
MQEYLYERNGDRFLVPAEVATRVKDDINYLVFQASGSLFGGYHENPLKRFYKQPIYFEELKKEVRPRSTCCFSYLTNNKKRCVTCPHTCAAFSASN